MLNTDALKETNLIIGAVQNDQIKLVANFAQKNKIKYVIPFTSKNDDVLSNAYVYQVNTPHSYLYANASQAGCDLFAEDNIILLNIKDEDEKADFIKAFKAEMRQRNIRYNELQWRFFPDRYSKCIGKWKTKHCRTDFQFIECIEQNKIPAPYDCRN